MNKICIGCGATLQSENPKQIGYVDKELINREDVLCLRCHGLKNYRKNQDVFLSKDDYLKVVQKIAKTDSLVVSLVDIFDFSGSFISSIKRHTGQTDILLVGNKSDLLPKSVKEDKVVRWMRHMAKLEGFNVLDCILISSKSETNLDKLLDSIDRYSKGRDCYIVGSCNVGKSTLLNSIIKKYSGVTKDVITASPIPGTTLDFIRIPYENQALIDTPGLVIDSRMIHHVPQSIVDVITPKKEIKPMLFQLNSHQTIFMGGLAWITYLEGERNTFAFYFSNEVVMHRTKEEAKERILNEGYQRVLIPTLEVFDKSQFTETRFIIKEDGKKHDVVISGYGFISISKGANLSITTLKGVGVYLREAII